METMKIKTEENQKVADRWINMLQEFEKDTQGFLKENQTALISCVLVNHELSGDVKKKIIDFIRSKSQKSSSESESAQQME